MNKCIIMFLSIIMLGCATTEIKDIEIIKNEKEIEIPFNHPTDVVQPDFENISFVVINENNIEVVFRKDKAYIALTVEDYKKLSRNMQQIIKVIKQQNETIQFYKKNVK